MSAHTQAYTLLVWTCVTWFTQRACACEAVVRACMEASLVKKMLGFRDIGPKIRNRRLSTLPTAAKLLFATPDIGGRPS